MDLQELKGAVLCPAAFVWNRVGACVRLIESIGQLEVAATTAGRAAFAGSGKLSIDLTVVGELMNRVVLSVRDRINVCLLLFVAGLLALGGNAFAREEPIQGLSLPNVKVEVEPKACAPLRNSDRLVV
jgi:hypothetical protein